MIVIYKTDTAIPLEAFNTFGVNSKVIDNPLGRFGTGLKYAVSVILRTGGKINVWVDGVEHVFYLKKEEFRGKSFEMIRMKKAKSRTGWFYTKLPFTTELGKEWEPWQAHRELASNTTDENGTIFYMESLDDYVVESAGTTIIVDWPHNREIFEDETPVFLDRGEKFGEPIFENEFVEIYDRPSKVLYFRTVRAYDLRNPSRFTYNFKKDVDLSEDRTIKNIWWVEHLLCGMIRNNINDKRLLERMMSEGDEDSYETHDLAIHDSKAGDAFTGVVHKLHNTGSLGRSAGLYHTSYIAAPPAPRLVSVQLSKADWLKVCKTLREAGSGLVGEILEQID